VSVSLQLVLAGMQSPSSSDDSVYSVGSVDGVISDDADDDGCRRCCRL
jgi:hypothetical protein